MKGGVSKFLFGLLYEVDFKYPILGDEWMIFDIPSSPLIQLDRYRQKGIVPFYQLNGGKVFFRYKDLTAIRDKVKNNYGRNHFSELISNG